MIRLRSSVAAAAVLTCLLFPALSWAADPSKTKTTPATGEDTPVNLPTDDGGAATTQGATSSGSLVRTIVGLAIVLLV
ncbi:MAG: hypothetical protein JHC95_21440, partial [Solirubrobacteraceae bacterium]|nr:hypothetical protein [Solirubrobacteraceae bacterium]